MDPSKCMCGNVLRVNPEAVAQMLATGFASSIAPSKPATTPLQARSTSETAPSALPVAQPPVPATSKGLFVPSETFTRGHAHGATHAPSQNLSVGVPQPFVSSGTYVQPPAVTFPTPLEVTARLPQQASMPAAAPAHETLVEQPHVQLAALSTPAEVRASTLQQPAQTRVVETQAHTLETPVLLHVEGKPTAAAGVATPVIQEAPSPGVVQSLHAETSSPAAPTVQTTTQNTTSIGVQEHATHAPEGLPAFSAAQDTTPTVVLQNVGSRRVAEQGPLPIAKGAVSNNPTSAAQALSTGVPVSARVSKPLEGPSIHTTRTPLFQLPQGVAEKTSSSLLEKEAHKEGWITRLARAFSPSIVLLRLRKKRRFADGEEICEEDFIPTEEFPPHTQGLPYGHQPTLGFHKNIRTKELFS
jgi:hypothetical protein